LGPFLIESFNGGRIISIETKLAYQEDIIQALNDVVCQQDKRIEQLAALASWPMMNTWGKRNHREALRNQVFTFTGLRTRI